MNKVLWKPTLESIERANLTHYIQWLSKNLNLSFENYDQLWKWSTDNIDDFWKSLWDYFGILYEGTYTSVRSGDQMPGIKWFEGARLNYAEHVFRNFQTGQTAIIHASEKKSIGKISWDQLKHDTAAFQNFLISSKHVHITSIST